MKRRRGLTGLVVAMVLAVFMPCKGEDAVSKDPPVTAAIRDTDDETTKATYSKLEEIRQKVLNLKPGVIPWRTGQEAFPHLQVLADRWTDPRSEAILKQLAATGPKRIEGELLEQTLAYAAGRYLILLEDNREYDRLLKGVDNPDDRVRKIREHFDAHPDLLATKSYGTANRPIVSMLLNEAEKLTGAEVIDLLVRSQLYGTDHFTQYKEALLDYAKKIGTEKTVAIPYLLQYILASNGSNAIPIIAACLEVTTRERDAESLAFALARFPNGEEHLLRNLNHRCPKVVRFIARRLQTRLPQDVVKALSNLLDRRRREGANNTEISDIERELRDATSLLQKKQESK